jgi:hypothetical protein
MGKFSEEELERRRERMIRLNKEGRMRQLAGRWPGGQPRFKGEPAPPHVIRALRRQIEQARDELETSDQREQAARLFRNTHQERSGYRTGVNPGGFYL